MDSNPSQPLSQVVPKVEESLTVVWDKIEAWQQDNTYIRSGYRPASGSYIKSWQSLGYWHNETVNIYTHLVGAIMFAMIALTPWARVEAIKYDISQSHDVYVFACFFLGAVTCLGMSATYHTIANHSKAVNAFGNKLDYLGIVFLIWGSFIPSIYYGFACRPALMKTYWTMITTIGAACAMSCTLERFRSPAWRPLRAAMFVSMGLSAVVPVVHGLYLDGFKTMMPLIALRWLVLQGSLYVIGAGIYAARIPERFNPGRYDHIGSSHQIFHVLVVLAAISHLIGLIKAYRFHHSSSLSLLCATINP